MLETVERDAETEDRSSEEGRGYAIAAEGDFQQEVCGGSGEASMQSEHDVRYMHEDAEEQSVLLFLWQLSEDPRLCAVWQNQVHGVQFRLRRATSWSQR